jgi:hypothetical protein
MIADSWNKRRASRQIALALALALVLPEDISHRGAMVTLTLAVGAFSLCAKLHTGINGGIQWPRSRSNAGPVLY